MLYQVASNINLSGRIQENKIFKDLHRNKRRKEEDFDENQQLKNHKNLKIIKDFEIHSELWLLEANKFRKPKQTSTKRF
ncbi:CLUMA_CG020069, isoform A [Clunio marinus]|uniref:CLUMA_CG020069, isoform A n=1 Tax=Clunio marinus TaxID=568069 RepID=A0A1J1J7U2_9DIPT|nr:CLUMA_CG020069, isoform A [Clunio marinus]